MTRFPLIVFAALLLTACSWVDSTGRQADTEGDSGNTPRLSNGGALSLEEEAAFIVEIPASASTRGQWSWTPADTDADPASCGNTEAFEPAITETRLASACADLTDCDIRFEELDGDGSPAFRITAPRLVAPVVIDYRGSAVDALGNPTEFGQTLCLQSINEAPSAQDDHYLMVSGKTRIVAGDASDSLLHNDSDDDDIRNQPLTIDPIPVIAPQFAEEFSLQSDGGFRYRPADEATADAEGIVRDSFTYVVSDGLHRSTATAHIEIVASNDPPISLAQLPDIDIALDDLQDGFFEFIVSDFFSDPDGDTLSFLSDSTLPGDGAFLLTGDGRLSGILTSDDLGSYRITIVVSDGFSSVAETIDMTVVQSHRPNSPPEVDDIDNRVVRGSFKYDVSGFFVDPDGDTLSFTASGLPDGVTISTDGVISGKADDDNEGFWLIRVTADDGRGGSADDAFRLVIL